MTRILLGIDFELGRFTGHGRIQLLELIATTGSIAQAAKAMDMSYKRAWYLMDDFSGCFSEPLVERRHGGKAGGSAALTPLGREILDRYRAMEKATTKEISRHLAAIEPKLAARVAVKAA